VHAPQAQDVQRKTQTKEKKEVIAAQQDKVGLLHRTHCVFPAWHEHF